MREDTGGEDGVEEDKEEDETGREKTQWWEKTEWGKRGGK